MLRLTFLNVLLLAITFVAYTYGWWSRSNNCSDSECQYGLCIQVGSTTIRSCSSTPYHDELRKKRGAPGFQINRYLYRVLRDDEDPRTNGIAAKDPGARKSIQSHVGCGSKQNYASQYISCTTDYQAALDYARLANERSGRTWARIAVIDRVALQNRGYVVHDLHEARDVLPGIMAYNYAQRYNEALVERYIPPACITDVQQIATAGRRRNRC